MAVRHALITALSVGAGLCSPVAVPKTNPVQNTTFSLYITENTYPQNYNFDPIELCDVHDQNGGQAVCALPNFGPSSPYFTFVPDKKNIAKHDANSGILIYEGEGPGTPFGSKFVSNSGDGAEMNPGYSNPQNLFVGGNSTNGPVSFYYNYQSEAFGVISHPKSTGPPFQQSQFFICETDYQFSDIYQVPNLVYTPTGEYPGEGCENVTLIASN